MRRRVAIAIMLAFTLGQLLFYVGCSRTEEGGEEADEALTFDLYNPVIQERLGPDDGYAFALFYGGDVHGSLETCG